MKTLVDSYLTIKFFIMRNLFNTFIKDVLQMAHEDPPGSNGGNNTGTGTGTGTNTEDNSTGENNSESLNNGENPSSNTEGGNSSNSSGGGSTEDGKLIPDVGIGAL